MGMQRVIDPRVVTCHPKIICVREMALIFAALKITQGYLHQDASKNIHRDPVNSAKSCTQ